MYITTRAEIYILAINAYNINKVSEEVDILTYMRQNPFAYWAKANGAVLYDRYREGIYLYIDPAECFLVTKESAEWLDVIYMCQGGINFWGKIKPDNVRRINDISDCVAVVNNPNPQTVYTLEQSPKEMSCQRVNITTALLYMLQKIKMAGLKFIFVKKAICSLNILRLEKKC